MLPNELVASAAEQAEILQRYRRIAVVGLSSKAHRPSHGVARYLLDHGYTIIPVNPSEREIFGLPCYPNLAAIPGPIEIVNIFRDPAAVPAIVEEAITVGAKVIWMQLGASHLAAAQRARAAGLAVVMERCIKVVHAQIRL